MQNKDYASVWGVSQSILKDFRFKSPKKWKAIHIDKQVDEDKKEDTFVFGSLVDTMMFTPEQLNDRFYMGEQKLPSKAIETIIKNTYERITSRCLNTDTAVLPDGDYEVSLAGNDDLILHYCGEYQETPDKEKGWGKAWKPETRIAKINQEGGEYFNCLKECGGRKIISQQMNFEAIELQEILLNDDIVKMYFIPDEGIELKFQFEIFVDFVDEENNQTVPLKGALDILRIDHNTKTIQIADFKTSYTAYDFINSIKKFSYATQLSFYDYILRLWLDQHCEGKYCDYTILNPVNIVIDKFDKVPYLYEYSWTDLEMERNGNEKYLVEIYGGMHNQKVKKGWMELLKTVSWHLYNDYWEKTKEYYMNGKIKVNLLNQ